MESKPKETRDVKYEECPFCDRRFIDRSYVGDGLYKRMLGLSEVDEHIEKGHRKRWVVKGSRGRWLDIDVINKRLQGR
ncbi:hypothetical protein [Nitrososphaera viennensis]|uniref:Uncharacterized protein n=2 Tax=Nitrososphaera viennensis TaxID=1034015 RepID=A0A060HUR7_9ARCH|nr:hypothetical protein [Nitrososphaera viennensis]AIC17171.1 hypothetical protein NVIE_028950 [Nitrososphaera viennensis EN76]UVS69061.1 hypothetical protein NWT39_14285 [Nitrososphaera viennensis]